ncbi:MAG: tetratricopeptide repeat protein [Verrucomicrobia bacterium]|nr:tetratricopeptide repeat protein [Verrucomicrobiota bacterium]
MSAHAGSRLSRFGTCCLHRAPAVLAFCFAIAAGTFATHAAEAPTVSKDAKPSAATKEGLAALKKRFNMAANLFFKGQYAQAEKELHDILNIYKRDLGLEHPETLNCRVAVGGLLLVQNRPAEAESEFRAILAIRERVLGTDHPDALSTCYGIAQCLAAQNKIPEALLFARRAADGLANASGKAGRLAKPAKKLVEELEQSQKKK